MRRKIPNRRARYAVGYGRPPTSSQFQPGQSGNPQARPKGVHKASSMARVSSSGRSTFLPARGWQGRGSKSSWGSKSRQLS